MAINFPNSPSPEDTYTVEGRTWIFRGGVWISQSASTSAGDGDVLGPGVAVVSGNLVAFDGTEGTAIVDSGVAPSDFATAAQGALADSAIQSGANISELVNNSGFTDDQTGAEIKAAYEAEADTNAFTDAEQSKLGAIEASADVTDAANVGSSIHGASAKATLVDADKFALIDSEASNVLKTSAWSVIKAAIKTYYDSVTATLTNKTLTTPVLTNPTVTNYVETVYAPSAGSSFTIDLANGTVQKLTTNANTTITLPASVAGKSFVLIVAYGGTHTLTWAGGSTLKWGNAGEPTETSSNTKFDIFTFFQDGTNTYGSTFGLNF